MKTYLKLLLLLLLLLQVNCVPTDLFNTALAWGTNGFDDPDDDWWEENNEHLEWLWWPF